MGAVVAVVFGSDVPLNAEGTAVARVGSESSEELLQAEASKSTAPAIKAAGMALFSIRLDVRTDCYYSALPKDLSRAAASGVSLGSLWVLSRVSQMRARR